MSRACEIPKRTITTRFEGITITNWPIFPRRNCVVRSAGNLPGDMPLREVAFHSVGPEAGSVTAVERRRRGIADPAFRKDAAAAGDSIIQVEQAETCPIAGGREDVAASNWGPRGIEFDGDVPHAERAKQFVAGESQHVARLPADGFAHDSGKNHRVGARILPHGARRRPQRRLGGKRSHVAFEEKHSRAPADRHARLGDCQSTGHPQEVVDRDGVARIGRIGPFGHRGGPVEREPPLADENADERARDRLGARISQDRSFNSVAGGVTLGDDTPIVNNQHGLGSSVGRSRGLRKRMIESRPEPRIPRLDEIGSGNLRQCGVCRSGGCAIGFSKQRFGWLSVANSECPEPVVINRPVSEEPEQAGRHFLLRPIHAISDRPIQPTHAGFRRDPLGIVLRGIQPRNENRRAKLATEVGRQNLNRSSHHRSNGNDRDRSPPFGSQPSGVGHFTSWRTRLRPVRGLFLETVA